MQHINGDLAALITFSQYVIVFIIGDPLLFKYVICGSTQNQYRDNILHLVQRAPSNW